MPFELLFSAVQIRMPNAEARKKSEARSSKPSRRQRSLRISTFGFLSTFGFRDSDFLSVTLPHHKIERAQDGRGVAHHVAGQQVRQDAQVAERWRADFQPI